MGAMKELFMERCEEWADTINEYYGLDAGAEEVMEIIMTEKNPSEEFSLNWELINNSFTDTSPREEMADRIARSRTGMAMPRYGDSEDYKIEFEKKMNAFNQGEV
jgi:hypothetical protein